MEKEHYRQSPSLIDIAATVDVGQNFEHAHETFQRMLREVDEGTLLLPDDDEQVQRIRTAWSQYECVLEAERAIGIMESHNPSDRLETYELLPRYREFLKNDWHFMETCKHPEHGAPHLLMIGSGPLPITSYLFERDFGYAVTNVDVSQEALKTGEAILSKLDSKQKSVYAPGGKVKVAPDVTGVIIAALAGSDRNEKMEIIANVASQLQQGGRISVRYGKGVRQLFYPHCELTPEEREELGLRWVGGVEPPRNYMNSIGVYEKC